MTLWPKKPVPRWPAVFYLVPVLGWAFAWWQIGSGKGDSIAKSPLALFSLMLWQFIASSVTLAILKMWLYP